MIACADEVIPFSSAAFGDGEDESYSSPLCPMSRRACTSIARARSTAASRLGSMASPEVSGDWNDGMNRVGIMGK